ncbi:MAG TPA: 2-phosphosulfolactate phosphatase [Chitinophagaceae bacterium]|nr:2-phosphosulfolactate phosphatase [Chitinophagaceae bacterium]
MKPSLYTILSPALLNLYDVSNSVVVIIDILRATSTIATAMENGAKSIIPVDSVAECIRIGKQIDAITAGERDGKVAEGLQHGNSPFEYPESFIKGRTLVLTTTNGTKLLHMALDKGATDIITGAFSNLDVICDYLLKQKKPVVLACAAWKDKVNMEDTLFAGAVIQRIREHVTINCDASHLALTLYEAAKDNMFEFMKSRNASHYQRLSSFGLERDIRFCLEPNTVRALPVYENGKLVNKSLAS